MMLNPDESGETKKAMCTYEGGLDIRLLFIAFIQNKVFLSVFKHTLQVLHFYKSEYLI